MATASPGLSDPPDKLPQLILPFGWAIRAIRGSNIAPDGLYELSEALILLR
jgi:hypothetical protein